MDTAIIVIKILAFAWCVTSGIIAACFTICYIFNCIKDWLMADVSSAIRDEIDYNNIIGRCYTDTAILEHIGTYHSKSKKEKK